MITLKELSGEEQFLLKWLSKEDSSAYGECYGYSLNTLINTGLAATSEKPPSDFSRVSLTEAGWAALSLQQGKTHEA